MPLWVRTVLVTAKPEDAAPALAAHLEHVQELRRNGKLHAAGAFTREDGFLEIFEAADLHEAEAIARASPLVAEGLAAWHLREWIPL